MKKFLLVSILFLSGFFSGCFDPDKNSAKLVTLAGQLATTATAPGTDPYTPPAPPPLENGLQIYDEFNFSWNESYSPDGLWCRSSWVATGNNLFTFANAQMLSSYSGATGGVLQLSVTANQLEGGEIQSVGDNGSSFGYGYYEVRMKLTNVSGCCVSFFWIQSPGYGPGEIDIEFLTNENDEWGSTSGTVWYSLHPYGGSDKHYLPFDPSADFHRYGFLWTPTHITFTVDGAAVRTYTDGIPDPAPGYIMANAWTGNPNWGGGPPAQRATSTYDWIKFYPDVTVIPPE